MLSLDIEFLLGVCFAAQDQTETAPDWPPQVDRVFSALVASWAARGERAEERDALRWLELLPPPVVCAPVANARTAPIVFVPPNDAKASQVEVLPERRRRQPRRFPAALPSPALISLSWPEANPDPATFESLQALARDTPYVGHSSSVVRCFFSEEGSISASAEPTPSIRRVYAGRFEELQTAYRTGRRPTPGESIREPGAIRSESAASVFGPEWLAFADAGGTCPDLRATAVVARAVRTAVFSGFQSRPIPEVISGHSTDGKPSSRPHLAILPLADIGWEWSEGRLMGVALCLPRSVDRSDETALFAALGEVMRAHGSVESGEIAIQLPGAGVWRLVRQAEPLTSSLRPFRYTRAATTWATATPIALDRHPKSTGNQAIQDEMADFICDACTRIGLPKPKIVIPDKHSAIRGTAPAHPSPKSPAWMHWALPGSLNGRVLTHATLAFEVPVQGPVALGAGRFVGLGVCLPIDAEKQR